MLATAEVMNLSFMILPQGMRGPQMKARDGVPLLGRPRGGVGGRSSLIDCSTHGDPQGTSHGDPQGTSHNCGHIVSDNGLADTTA